jgi:hypothetical protein
LLLYEETIAGKWLGMLKEISPRLTRAALVANPKGFTYDHFVRSSKTIAPALGIELAPTPIENDAADIERRIEAFARAPNSGLFVPPRQCDCSASRSHNRARGTVPSACGVCFPLDRDGKGRPFRSDGAAQSAIKGSC